tara:strand:- start:55 stop:588 length:534 start_codon:yes stop_codon:yes gene_type:complete
MTKYVICAQDMMVMINDRHKRFPDYTPAPSKDINYFRFDTETNSGQIEYLDRGTQHEPITSIPDEFQAIIDHAEADHAEEERLNALPYYEKEGYDNWDRVRRERNSFLYYLDQYIIPKDYPYNDGEKENLISFRKKLRDIPTDHASSEPKNIRFTPELNIEIDGVTTELHERWKENA